jgi:GAF domain-containing protein
LERNVLYCGESMSLGVIQTGANNSGLIIAAIFAAVLAVALMIFLLARASSRKRVQEARTRERLIEMEREAQFAAASDRLAHSREPREVALHLASLFREYLSIPVLAVYVGRESDANLHDVLITKPDKAGVSSQEEMPASVPASMLRDHLQPREGKLAEILDHKPDGSSPTEERTAAHDSIFGEPSLAAEHIEMHQPSESARPRMGGRGEERVMLRPWRGPFRWSGLIVSSVPEGMTAETLEGYGEPVERLTDRLALALEFERTDAALEAANQRAARTADFSRSVISYLEEVSPLDSIVREVKRLVDSDSAGLWRVDKADSMVRMVAAHGLKSSEFLPLPLGQGLAGNVAQSGVVLALEDAPSDPRCIFPREARESGITSYLGAPLASEGETLGVIEVHSARHRLWTENDRCALESAATIIAELVKSTDSRGDRLRVETAYLGLSEALQRLRSPEEVKEAVVEVLGHALGGSRVMVVEFDEQDRPETIKQEYRQPSVKSAVGATFEEALVTRVAEAAAGGQPITISNSRENSLMGTDNAVELGVLSEMAVPIRIDGKTRSIIYVHQCDREREWEKEELEFAERVVRQLSLTLSNLHAFELASTEAKQAREEARQAFEESGGASARVQELEKQIESFERVLAQSRAVEDQVRSLLAKASALEAKARAEADVTRRSEAEAKQQLERAREELNQAHDSSRQLLDINKLKSEFIVNAGHEIEASLQSVLGLTEMLERGSYGELSLEQQDTVHHIYGWARRIKSDVDWLIEYGSTRSRRLESSGGS